MVGVAGIGLAVAVGGGYGVLGKAVEKLAIGKCADFIAGGEIADYRRPINEHQVCIRLDHAVNVLDLGLAEQELQLIHHLVIDEAVQQSAL